MNLKGWDYTGRNIGPDFHKQFRLMIVCLSEPSFTNHCSWGNDIQDRLAGEMHMTSAGAVRTVKRMCSNFGLLNEEAFSSRDEIINNDLLTTRGKLIFNAATLEQQVEVSQDFDDLTKERVYSQIKKLYEEAYCEALKYYYFTNNDGSFLHPLRATLRAVKKYGNLDKWEWYLLNTYIRHDDDYEEEKTLEEYIQRYREGEFHFSMNNVVEKPKGHQYTPQYFEFAGLFHVVQRPEWCISDSGRHNDIKHEVMEDDFLKKVYGGRL